MGQSAECYGPNLMSHQPQYLDNTAFSLLQASANPQKLPGALLAGGPVPSLETGHADLDRGAFSAVLGLGNDSTLAQIQRSVQMASGAEPADISSLLAASIGVPPVRDFTEPCSRVRLFITLLTVPGQVLHPFSGLFKDLLGLCPSARREVSLVALAGY